jgi:hypothetical protein
MSVLIVTNFILTDVSEMTEDDSCMQYQSMAMSGHDPSYRSQCCVIQQDTADIQITGTILINR